MYTAKSNINDVGLCICIKSTELIREYSIIKFFIKLIEIINELNIKTKFKIVYYYRNDKNRLKHKSKNCTVKTFLINKDIIIQDFWNLKVENFSIFSLDDSIEKRHHCDFNFCYEFNVGRILLDNQNFVYEIIFSVTYSEKYNLLNGTNCFYIFDYNYYISILNNYQFNPIYGYITKMPRDYKILSYMAGIGVSSFYSDKEIEFANIYSSNQEGVISKIREPFWGNILTKNHIVNDSLLNQIRKIVGGENVKQLENDYFYFQMPISIDEFEYNSEFHLNMREKLTNLFESYDLILKRTA